MHARREAGYHDALKAAGISPGTEWMRALLRPWEYGYNYGNDFVRAGRDGMKAWLEDKSMNGFRKLRCTAILAHNDEVAVGIIAALGEANLAVPKDVSVVGYDGVEIGEYSSPRLTTVEVPLRQIGNAATEMLLRQIGLNEVASGQTFERRVLPIQLRVRESTSAPFPQRSLYRSVQDLKNPRPIIEETTKLLLGEGVAMREEWQQEIESGRCVLAD